MASPHLQERLKSSTRSSPGKVGATPFLILSARIAKLVKGEQGLLAAYLADLDDPRALPDLHEALRRTDDWVDGGEIAEAIVKLGGELSAAEEARTRRLRAQMWPEPAPAEQPRPRPVAKPEPMRVTKIGRNEPCPCGSGKKYKKCCGC